MSKTTTVNGATITKTSRDIVIHSPEGVGGAGLAQVQVFSVTTTTPSGVPAIVLDNGLVYQAPLATCLSGPSTTALAAALNVTPAALKTALVAWFDGMVSEAIIQ